jgi:prevent-host-death family protein
VFVTDDPNLEGNVAELAFAAEAAKLGLSVFKPLTEHERYDLVVGLGGRLLRVQCKWAPRRGDVICVRISGSRHSPTRGYIKSTYTAEEVDAVGAYCAELEACYLLPPEVFSGKSALHLRLRPARNGQTAALNFAANYELGAIAQQEERLRGTQEVAGSSPASSMITEGEDQLVLLKDIVGMDEFHARLAHYVRRAESGQPTQITRWGRPVARLVPP